MGKKDTLLCCADCGSTEYYIIKTFFIKQDKIVCNGCGKVCGYATQKSGALKTKKAQGN